MLDNYVMNIYSKILPRVRKTFFIAMFWGIISHMYILTNLLYNHDGVVSMYVDVNALTSGRWFLKYATAISGHMQTPVVIVLLSLIYLAVLCCATVEIFDINSYVHIFVAAGLIITFPTIVCTFSYLFTADAYFLAAMLAVLAVYCTKKFQKGWIAAIFLLAFSMGIYQAYLSYAAGIFVVLVGLMVFDPKAKLIDMFKEGIKYVLVLGASVGLYYIILQIMLKLNGVVLNNYRGINEMGKYTLAEIPQLLLVTYKEILEFYFSKGTYSYIPDFVVDVNRIIGILLVILLIYLGVTRKVYKNIEKIILGVILIIVWPLALNFMQIANTQEAPHVLMILSYVLFYIAFIKLVDMAAAEWDRNIIHTTAIVICNILCLVILYRGYTLTNEGYLRLQLAYESTYSFATRIAYSVEHDEVYTVGKPVYIGGNFNYTEYPTRREDFNEFSEFTGIYSDYIVYSNKQLEYFIKDTLNLVYTDPDPVSIEAIRASDTYVNMPCYPENGSIQEIEGVLVVKLSEEE